MIGAIVAKKKIRAAYDALSRHDIDAFLADWAEDVTFVYPGNLSVSGEMKGKEAIREWFQRVIDRFPVIIFNLKSVCVQNIFDLTGTNVITVEWEERLQNQDGEEFVNSGVTVIQLKARKAVSVYECIFDIEQARRMWGE